MKCLLKCFIGIRFFQTSCGFEFNDLGVWVLVSVVLIFFIFFYFLAEGKATPVYLKWKAFYK